MERTTHTSFDPPHPPTHPPTHPFTFIDYEKEAAGPALNDLLSRTAGVELAENLLRLAFIHVHLLAHLVGGVCGGNL